MVVSKKDSIFYLFGLFHVGSVIVGMTFTARFIDFYIPQTNYPIHITGGFFFIPIVFFLQDIITEIYGFRNGRLILYTTIVLFILYVLMLQVLSFLLSAQNANGSREFIITAETLPRQTVSFICSLGVGGIINSLILTKLKFIFRRRFLAIRFVVSTAIGEAFFQFIAILIAWYGQYSISSLIPLAVSSYIYKVVFEGLTSPVNIYICKYLRSLET